MRLASFGQMKSSKVIAVLMVSSWMPFAAARTWTDTTGRTIEAELLEVQGEKVILEFKGKEVPLGLERLSEGDRKFVEEWQKEREERAREEAEKEKESVVPAEAPVLCGVTLDTSGGVTEVEEDLSAEALKSFEKASEKPFRLKLAVALPAGFDPAKPQKVMWVSAAINSEEERKRGNLGAIRKYAKTATDAGWVVVAADTDLGNPRMEDNQRSSGGDLAVHANAVEVFAKAWPGFKTWKFACCGHSGGAKASFYRAAELLACDLEVVGMFLSGCNQDMTEDAREETRCRKAGLRKIRVFISSGTGDKIATTAHSESLRDSVKSAGYGEVRLESFDGGHTVNLEDFTKAMAWFSEPAK